MKSFNWLNYCKHTVTSPGWVIKPVLDWLTDCTAVWIAGSPVNWTAVRCSSHLHRWLRDKFIIHLTSFLANCSVIWSSGRLEASWLTSGKTTEVWHRLFSKAWTPRFYAHVERECMSTFMCSLPGQRNDFVCVLVQACCSLLLYNIYCITTGSVWVAPAIWRHPTVYCARHYTLKVCVLVCTYAILCVCVHPTATNRYIIYSSQASGLLFMMN